MPKLISRSFVLATALVPTTGHRDLIEFAKQISDEVVVIVQGRSFEPVGIHHRVSAISEYFATDVYFHRMHIFSDLDDNSPQNPDSELERDNPGGDIKFWDYWVDRIKFFDKKAGLSYSDNLNTAIIASEPYGKILADKMGIQFIPYDINRDINNVKGTDVRQCISHMWEDILPTFRKHLQMNVVIFGQESVGKTTMARTLSQSPLLPYHRFIPEFARGYLESVGSEITDEKMKAIHRGQMAYQQMAYDSNSRVNYFDTDLLSTIGYHRIFEGRQYVTPQEDWYYHPELFEDVMKTKDKHIYVLLPDDIPFEPDPLRYGGDKRESTYGFWKTLLDQYGCNYYTLPTGLDFDQKFDYIQATEQQLWVDKIAAIRNFVRD